MTSQANAQPTIAHWARQLACADLTIEKLRAIRQSVGDMQLSSVLDGMSQNDLCGLVRRVDPYCALAAIDMDALGARAARDHVTQLARGAEQPTQRPNSGSRIVAA